MEVNETSLYLLGVDLSPFLKIKDMLPMSLPDRTTPVFRDMLTMSQSDGATPAFRDMLTMNCLMELLLRLEIC